MKRRVAVLILCGGKGERLRPLTESLPKPLVEIKGRPILSYLIDHTLKFGIADIVIAAGFKSEKIRDFFSVNYKETSVQIVDSGNVDIIDRIRDCEPYLHSDFIVLYGDTLADVDLDKLQEFHLHSNAQATVALFPLKSQFGLATLDDDSNVTRFEEKPTLDKWINIGNFYYTPEVFSWMKGFDSYATFLEHLGQERKLKGYRHNGVHITVNTFQELEDAERNIHEFAPVAPPDEN